MIRTTGSWIADHGRRARLTFGVSDSDVRRIVYLYAVYFQAALIFVSSTYTSLTLGAVSFVLFALALGSPTLPVALRPGRSRHITGSESHSSPHNRRGDRLDSMVLRHA